MAERRILSIFATAFRKECKTYCSIDSQSPPEKKRANIHYLGCPAKGADFPYMYVACGEPRVVWRKSAPLLWRTETITLTKKQKNDKSNCDNAVSHPDNGGDSAN